MKKNQVIYVTTPLQKVSGGGKNSCWPTDETWVFRKAVVAEAPSCISHTDSLTITHLHIEHYVKCCINKTLNQGYRKKLSLVPIETNISLILADQFQFDLTCLSGPKETHT